MIENGATVYEGDGVYNFKTNDFIDVEIGGIIYPSKKIGGLIWICKNLENEIGTLNSDYKEYDKSKYGLLYKVGSVDSGNVKNFVDGIGDGWRIPTSVDGQNLKNYLVGIGLNPVYALKAKSNLWNTNNGTNETGFSALPSGDYSTQIEHIGDYFHMHLKNRYQFWIGSNSWEVGGGLVPTGYYFALRLCKDA